MYISNTYKGVIYLFMRLLSLYISTYTNSTTNSISGAYGSHELVDTFSKNMLPV